MKTIDFLIFYEHKNREFESIVLLKHELVKRGYTVEFFSFYETHFKKKRKALFNNVEIAVMPSLYYDENILHFVYAVAGKVKNIVNLRWEQLFSNQMEQKLDYFVYPKQNAKKGYHLCWGQRPLEMLRNAGVEDSNLFITGPIQMDFLREELSGFYHNKEELFAKYGIDLEKKCILFSSSFVVSSYNKWELEWFFSQYEEDEIEYYKSFLSREIESKESIVKWLTQLAEEKDCIVIYRPHPAEAKTDIIEQLKVRKNFKVISDYNIKQWILTCDQVYTWHSTSIAEATVAGVPCAVLRPVELDFREEYPIYDRIPFISSYQELSDYYDSSLNESSNQFVSDEKLNYYLSIDPEKPSYIRIADVLEQAFKNDYYFPWESFSCEQLSREKERVKKQDQMDLISKLIITPFYFSSFTKKVAGRLFSKMYSQYSSAINFESAVISENEFSEMEKRISAVIDRNLEE